MLIVFSAFSLAAGTGLACAQDRHPERLALYERLSGFMVVTGLALIGGALPLFR